jgi:hypothetical protein
MWPHAPAVRRPAQPAAGRALHLRHDQTVPVTLRFRYAAQPARYGAVRGGRAAQQTKAARGCVTGDLSEAQDLINIEERAGEDLEADEPPLALSSEDL